MSQPNISDDAQAPLLTSDRPEDAADETSDRSGNRTITIFNRTFSLFHVIAAVVGALALIAIGISIAAIGMFLINWLSELLVDRLLVLAVESRGDSDSKRKPRKSHTENVCLTPECVQLSADILRSRGDADPCEDFYTCFSQLPIYWI